MLAPVRERSKGTKEELIRRPIAVDLFAGVGGFSLGFEQAGFDVVACVEYDPIHAAVHAFNFPRTEVLCADVATVSGKELRAAIRRGCKSHKRDDAKRPRVDVVIGGPPCQGFSVGGKLKFDDERNRLVFAFAQAIAEIKPRYFVMENVPAMRSAVDVEPGQSKSEPKAGSLLNSLFAEFDRLGYDICEEEVLNARDFGVPQDRRRLIVLGALRGLRAPTLPKPSVRARPKRTDPLDAESSSGLLASLPIGPSISRAIGDLPNLDCYEQLLLSDSVELRADEWNLTEADDYARIMHGDSVNPDDLSYPRSWDRHILTSSLRTGHSADSKARFAATTPGHTEPISRFYRLDPNGLSNTLRAGTGYERGSFSAPRPIHPVYPRVISVREAARLQSFPDWFRFHVTKWHGFRQVGNALPPIFARQLGEAIRGALRINPVRPQTVISLGDATSLGWGMQEAAAQLGIADDVGPGHRNRFRTSRNKPGARAAQAAA
jgi:DNA (cytosine-5)-methyltransferase 1